MRTFRELDPTSLKAFYFAAETLNFTRAARFAALTQSGVSQHVLKLEHELGVDLFKRVGRTVQLTSAGVRLKYFAESYLDQVESLFEEVRQEGRVLRGLVRYAMPASCLMSPHFSMLLSKRREFSEIDLRVRICHSEEVVDSLIKGESDFGFVTRSFAHRDLVLEEFAREEYLLVSASDSGVTLKSARDLLEQDFIFYPGMEVLLSRWLETQFPKSRSPVNERALKVRGMMNSLDGAITFTSHGVGLCVFPRHCIEKELASKKLIVLEDRKSAKKDYPIFIIRTKSRPPARVQRVLDAFWSMKNES